MAVISVIVPVYKVEKFLDRCINSIIQQTFTNLEIILVDDGSPDRSGEICDEWKMKDKRIRVIHKENGGLSDARNKGLDVATGDYVAFIDSDDWIDPDMFQLLYDATQKYQADIAECSWRCIYSDESRKKQIIQESILLGTMYLHCMEKFNGNILNQSHATKFMIKRYLKI